MRIIFLVVFLPAVLVYGQNVIDISTEDVEGVPPDQECGFQRFLRETEKRLPDYGPNVCSKKAVYLESRTECVFRRVCRRQNFHFYCWYACRGTKRCITHENSYTFQPSCCTGFASAADAGISNRSVDLLKTEGCPIEKTAVSKATCVIQGPVQGNITVTQVMPLSDVQITGILEGLTPGKHGFHVHEYGSFLGGCGAAGGHYNPFDMSHGAPTDSIRHVGDLGNIVADSSGVAIINISDNQVKLNGPTSVIGRSFVVHADTDDLGQGGVPASLTTGNAGARVGCCTIAIARA